MENKGKRYPREIRDKAVRMVDEHQGEYPSQWACTISIVLYSRKMVEMPARASLHIPSHVDRFFNHSG